MNDCFVKLVVYFNVNAASTLLHLH